MLKKLYPYTKGCRKWIALGVLFSAGETVFELLLPLTMADIVDIGIKNGDQAYILSAGIKMIVMAVIALVLGGGAAGIAAYASQRFGANLRAAEYEKVQDYIVNELSRGVTLYQVVGGFKNDTRTEIITILTRSEYGQLLNYLHSVDQKAFVTVSTVNQVIGHWNVRKRRKK